MFRNMVKLYKKEDRPMCKISLRDVKDFEKFMGDMGYKTQEVKGAYEVYRGLLAIPGKKELCILYKRKDGLIHSDVKNEHLIKAFMESEYYKGNRNFGPIGDYLDSLTEGVTLEEPVKNEVKPLDKMPESTVDISGYCEADIEAMGNLYEEMRISRDDIYYSQLEEYVRLLNRTCDKDERASIINSIRDINMLKDIIINI